MRKKLITMAMFIFASFMVAGLCPGLIWAEGGNEKNMVGSEELQATAVDGDYEYAIVNGGVEITNYTGAGGNITIPKTLGGNPVTRIGAFVFDDNTSLMSVTIPDSVTYIGRGTFSDCTSLKSVSIPGSVVRIEDFAFFRCSSLSSISIPDSVTYIGWDVFYECNSLSSVSIPDSLSIIKGFTFSGCSSLRNIIIPDSVTKIGAHAFDNCINLKTIQFNSSVIEFCDDYPETNTAHGVLPQTTVIIGYDPSTAKNYAEKFGNPFQLIDSNSNTVDYGAVSCSYQTHVQNVGWQNYVQQGNISGTTGKEYRLEGIRIALNDDGYDLGLEYQTHIQNIGWEADTDKGWSSSNEFSGTEGRGYRLEAIQIKLTGADADKFNIYYQVHAQNMGWLGLAKNGESAGTAGYGYRLEAIRVQIVPVGVGCPNWTVDKADPFYKNIEQPYQTIINEYRIAQDDIGNYETITNLPHVNPNIILQKSNLWYSLKDLTDDGNEELIIGMSPGSPTTDVYNNNSCDIYDIYTIRDGQAERVIDTSDVGNGHTSSISLLEDNKVCKFGNGTSVIYKILPDGNIEHICSIYNKAGTLQMNYDEKGVQKSKVITSQEYHALTENIIYFDWWEALWK